ncbi:MAG: DUF4465 domain-containing protein [Paludibacter sp.]|nr:DUF4465 domain-containing protein [Paludibacter sp.]MDD4199225.1 DUF4465 domain-containing protein [Paludibacter sp.]MDD4428989.1 DUF4465 domain-containing protein [Paludibacter sp.]
MKKSFVLLFAAFLFVACETETGHLLVNDFEDVVLDESGYYNGSDTTGTLIEGRYYNPIYSKSVSLINRYKPDWQYWDGFAVSSLTDSVTSGPANQYSVIAGHGASGSVKFALAYDSAEIHLPYINSYQKVKSVMLTNSTYAYYDMLKGSDYSKQFKAGDWFKVIIRGFSGDVQTGKVAFYLADFRDGKSLIVHDWTKVSLSALGAVDKLIFTFDSSDKGIFGVNTPKYVCVDDLVVEVEEGCDCLKD